MFHGLGFFDEKQIFDAVVVIVAADVVVVKSIEVLTTIIIHPKLGINYAQNVKYVLQKKESQIKKK